MDCIMNRIKKAKELKADLEILTSEKNGDKLRQIGSDSNVMAEHNLISEAYLKAACKFGSKDAFTDLGILYNHHFEILNHQKGFKNYLIAAKLGDRRAIRLSIRDSYWFNYNKGYEEIVQLGVQFKEPSAVSEYAKILADEGKIIEAISVLEAIQYVNPKILIEMAVIKLQNQYDEKEIIEDLIKFSEHWYKYILEFYTMMGLGDDGRFPYYCMDMQNKENIVYENLSTILKKEADSGNISASFSYSLFAFVGICLEKNNFGEYEYYMNKALIGGLKDGEKIKGIFDDPFGDMVEADEFGD